MYRHRRRTPVIARRTRGGVHVPEQSQLGTGRNHRGLRASRSTGGRAGGRAGHCAGQYEPGAGGVRTGHGCRPGGPRSRDGPVRRLCRHGCRATGTDGGAGGGARLRGVEAGIPTRGAAARRHSSSARRCTDSTGRHRGSRSARERSAFGRQRYLPDGRGARARAAGCRGDGRTESNGAVAIGISRLGLGIRSLHPRRVGGRYAGAAGRCAPVQPVSRWGVRGSAECGSRQECGLGDRIVGGRAGGRITIRRNRHHNP